jgi:hypothetical protein
MPIENGENQMSTITLANQSPRRVLPDLTEPALASLSKDQLLAMIDALRSAPRNRVSMKVSEKGCLSLYGLNTRGIHLYASQWERILDQADAIRAFIAANPTLARKS